MCIIAVLIIIIKSLTSDDKESSQAVSYLVVFIEQVIVKIVDLYWKLGLTNKFILYSIIILILPGICGAVAGILIAVKKFPPTSALALVGPGVSLSDWFAEYFV